MFLQSREISHANRTCPYLTKTWSEEIREKDVEMTRGYLDCGLGTVELDRDCGLKSVLPYQGLKNPKQKN